MLKLPFIYSQDNNLALEQNFQFKKLMWVFYIKIIKRITLNL